MGIRTGNPLWKNGGAGGTPITAANLNKIEDVLDSMDTSADVDEKIDAVNELNMSTYSVIGTDSDGTPIIQNTNTKVRIQTPEAAESKNRVVFGNIRPSPATGESVLWVRTEEDIPTDLIIVIGD